EDTASWTILSGGTTIAGSTETTIVRTITDDQVNLDDYFDSNGKITWAVYQSVSALTLNVDYVKMDVTSMAVEQEGYRFRADDGSETTATWLAAQDTTINRAVSTPTRLRTLINSIGVEDPDSAQYELEYKLSSDSTFYSVGGTPVDVTPTIESWSSGASTATNAAAHAITMPSGITAGDLLVIVFSTDGIADVSIVAGDWIKLDQEHEATNQITAAIFYKFATGSDTATVSTGSEQTSHIVYRISGASAPYVAQANGNSTNSNPANLDTGVSRNYLWLATASHDSTVVASVAPTNFSNLHTQAAAGVNGASTSTAERALTASSEDPGTFTSSTEQWVSFTLAIPSSSMGIKAAGPTPGQSTTSMLIAYPVGIEKGDLIVLGMSNKHTPNGPTTPTDWTAASNYQQSGASGADGGDTGSVYATVFYKIADGTEMGNLSVSIPSGSSAIGRMIIYSKEVGKEWDIAMANGSDTTINTTWSVTAGSDPGIIAGDMVLAVSGINTDAYSYRNHALTASGVTFDTAEKEIVEIGTSAGNDTEAVFSNHYAISGTSGAAPVYTMLSSSSATSAPAGATVLMRIRQVDAPITLTGSSNITASGDDTTAQLTAPSGKTTGDFLTGRMQDDENPADAINLSTTQYTELEWSITATSMATNGEVYQFRVTVNGVPIGTYTTYPELTIGTAASTFTQAAYRWYEDSDDENVTALWGNPDLAENAPLALIPATNAPPQSATELRLRVAITIGDSDLSASAQQFKLQYKAGTDAVCTTGSWSDVDAGGSGTIWRYATSSESDGTTLTQLKISSSDVLQVYAKSSPTTANPNGATVGQDVEYDFHIQHNAAASATTYSFRVVESDGTALTTYSNCPTLTTAATTDQQLRHGNVFSNETEAGFTRAD
ncbi:MAG: hypothetical protein WAU07_00835, partial [Microgenomates group bacterium]